MSANERKATTEPVPVRQTAETETAAAGGDGLGFEVGEAVLSAVGSVRRTRLDQRGLAPRDILRIQRTLGDRLTERMLFRSRSQPVVPGPGPIGPVVARYESGMRPKKR